MPDHAVDDFGHDATLTRAQARLFAQCGTEAVTREAPVQASALPHVEQRVTHPAWFDQCAQNACLQFVMIHIEGSSR